MGICLSPDEKKLALADQSEGLKILDIETGIMQTLTSGYEGEKFVSVNSITFEDEDTIYFTHTGNIGMEEYHYELLSKQPTGRIYRYHMKTGETQIFIDHLHFPNGIAYSKQDNCLYVCHLNKYQIISVPLDQRRGENKYSIIFDNLIGFPDNLKITEDNKLWVAIPSLRDKVTNMLDNNPIIRKILINSKIPLALFLNMANFSFSGAIKIDPHNGQVEDYFLGKSD